MRTMLLRLCALTLTLVLLAACALAEEWNPLPMLDGQPVEATIRAEIVSHMPGGDQRTADLNGLMKHVTLRLCVQPAPEESWQSAEIYVDDVRVAALTERTEGGVSLLEVTPGGVYSLRGGSAMQRFFGLPDMPDDLLGLRGGELTVPDDAAELLDAAMNHFDGRFKDAKKKVNLKEFGVGRVNRTLTIKKSEAAELAAELAALCPEGWLRDFIGSLTFTGKQTVVVLVDEAGTPLRVTYTGACGLDSDHQRNVKLTWTLSRGEVVRDELTLKSPAVKGKDKDTLTVSRTMTETEDGSVALTASVDYSATHDRQKSAFKADFDLTRTEGVDTRRISGTLALSRTVDGATEALTLTPDLVTGLADQTLTGTLGLDYTRNGQNREAAVLTLRVAPMADASWEIAQLATPLDGLTDDAVAALRTTDLRRVASALTKRFVLLPEEDTLYLSRDLPEETWQAIKDAARANLD